MCIRSTSSNHHRGTGIGDPRFFSANILASISALTIQHKRDIIFHAHRFEPLLVPMTTSALPVSCEWRGKQPVLQCRPSLPSKRGETGEFLSHRLFAKASQDSLFRSQSGSSGPVSVELVGMRLTLWRGIANETTKHHVQCPNPLGGGPDPAFTTLTAVLPLTTTTLSRLSSRPPFSASCPQPKPASSPTIEGLEGLEGLEGQHHLQDTTRLG